MASWCSVTEGQPPPTSRTTAAPPSAGSASSTLDARRPVTRRGRPAPPRESRRSSAGHRRNARPALTNGSARCTVQLPIASGADPPTVQTITSTDSATDSFLVVPNGAAGRAGTTGHHMVGCGRCRLDHDFEPTHDEAIRFRRRRRRRRDLRAAGPRRPATPLSSRGAPEGTHPGRVLGGAHGVIPDDVGAKSEPVGTRWQIRPLLAST